MNDKQLTPEEEEKEMMLLPKLAITKLLLKKIEQTATLQARVQELENQWKNRSTDYEIAMNRIAELNQHVPKLAKDKEQLYSVIVGHENTIIDSESRIAELERENKILKDKQEHYWNQGDVNLNDLLRAKQHAEKLMVLLESMFHLAHDHETGQSDWQSYKQENGLQSPENPLP